MYVLRLIRMEFCLKRFMESNLFVNEVFIKHKTNHVHKCTFPKYLYLKYEVSFCHAVPYS